MKVPPPSRSSSIPVTSGRQGSVPTAGSIQSPLPAVPANNQSVPARSDAPEWCKDVEWQRLWLSTLVERRDNWSSLALVPAGGAPSQERMLEIAQGLAYAGTTHLQAQVHVANGLAVGLHKVLQLSREIESYARPPHRVLIPLSPIDASLTTPTIARMADVCLLCVMHAETKRSDIQRTLESIGAARFLGAVVFHAPRARG